MRLLDDVVGDALRQPRFNAFVLSAFGVAGLFLSAIGSFGVFVYGVASRTREVGIRVAVGATRPDIVRMFLAQAMWPISVGVLVGTAASVLFARFVGALLFGVAPTDVGNYMVAAATLAGSVLLASYLPVRRMLRPDLTRVLRE